MLTDEEKKRFLEALKEDEEFRLAVAGLIGLGEILLELRRIHEDIEKLWRKSLEYDKEFKLLRKELLKHRRLIEYNRRDTAALTEAMISRYVYEDIVEEVKEKGEAIIQRKRNVRIDDMDVDLLIETNKNVYVVEVKIQPDHHDVERLLVKADLVSRKYGKRVKPVLAAIWVGREVEEYAKEKKVQVLTY